MNSQEGLSLILTTNSIIDIYDMLNDPLNYQYFYFGKNTPWDADVNGRTETERDFIVPDISPITDEVFRNDLMFLKKLNLNDYCLLKKYKDWDANTAYSAGSIVLSIEKSVYFATSNISKHKRMPLHLADNVEGWQFLYNIDDSEFERKFLDSVYLPIPNNNSFGINIGTVEPLLDNLIVPDAVAIHCDLSLKDKPLQMYNSFRRIGIIQNALTIFNQPIITNTETLITDGHFLYVANKKPIIRDSKQIESFKIILAD